MSRRTPSLWQFLEQSAMGRDSDRNLVLFREQLDRSELLATMGRVADAVNAKAGELLIDVQSYLPPEALVRSFWFHRQGQDYVLQLESWGPQPTVVFLTRKWRSLLFPNFLSWFYYLLGMEESVVDVRYSSLFRAERITEADVEKWFTYLISGFDRAFAPSIPQDRGIVSPQRLTKQTERVAES
jgi:hypothetical protein